MGPSSEINRTFQLLSVDTLHQIDPDHIVETLSNLVAPDNVSKTEITSWGGRLVHFPNTESIELYKIVKAFSKAPLNPISDQPTPDLRIAGLKLIKRLLALYTETDQNLENQSWLKKTVTKVRELRPHKSIWKTYRQELEKKEPLLRSFTHEQFEEYWTNEDINLVQINKAIQPPITLFEVTLSMLTEKQGFQPSHSSSETKENEPNNASTQKVTPTQPQEVTQPEEKRTTSNENTNVTTQQSATTDISTENKANCTQEPQTPTALTAVKTQVKEASTPTTNEPAPAIATENKANRTQEPQTPPAQTEPKTQVKEASTPTTTKSTTEEDTEAEVKNAADSTT